MDTKELFEVFLAKKRQSLKDLHEVVLFDETIDQQYLLELAELVENQKVMNEGFVENGVDLQFVYDVYSKFIGKDLVSIQSIPGPTSFVFYMDSQGNFKHEEIAARTRSLKTKLKPVYNKTQSDCVANELTREITIDLQNCAGHTKKINSKDLPAEIKVMRDTIHEDIPGQFQWWIITSPKLATELLNKKIEMDVLYNIVPEEIFLAGTLDGAALYVDTLFPLNKVLVGMRGKNPYNSGYLYCPYVPLTPVRNNEEVISLWIRYGKKLVNDKYYGVLNVEE